MSKFVYIVDYWLPFPCSEYGGIEVYVAENDQQVVDMIIEKYNGTYMIAEYIDRIADCVADAKKISAGNDAQIGYVDGFTT